MANEIETSSKNIKPWMNLNHNIHMPLFYEGQHALIDCK